MRHRGVLGFLGSTLDTGSGPQRWNKWRPSVSLCQHEDLLIHRFDLLYQPRFTALAETVMKDIQSVSPETEVRLTRLDIKDAWDFEEVYATLHDFARGYPFHPEKEDYLIHLTTGSHVAQICLFLLTESHHLPGKLLQTSPSPRNQPGSPGSYTLIDLDLSKYDRIATRFQREQKEGVSFLKGGIETRNARFNQMIDRIEQVAIASKDPILLMGPTGAGKSLLAKRVFELKKTRHQLTGEFVEVNCATLHGDSAMSTLFGHVKGAFTGAVTSRPGLLRKAHEGLLLLDEIGELGIDEQAMLLRALEEKSFLPLGSDKEVHSDFQLIAGTNRDLTRAVRSERFREDLLARINLWTFKLPSLRERPEDIEPNFDYELEKWAKRTGIRITTTKEAREAFLNFSICAPWPANFRDLNAAVARMATLSSGGRITHPSVREEIGRLNQIWKAPGEDESNNLLESILGATRAKELDRFDRIQLEDVLRVCQESRSLSEAGRTLFAISRTRKGSVNDADRLRKYLSRFGIEWKDLWTV